MWDPPPCVTSENFFTKKKILFIEKVVETPFVDVVYRTKRSPSPVKPGL